MNVKGILSVKALIALTSLSCLMLCTYCIAEASVISIKNENNSDLEIIVEPNEGSILPDSQDTKRILKKKEEKRIEVKESDFQGTVTTFSILGKVTTPSLHNRCGPLSIDRNYTVVFKPTLMGATECFVQTK